MEPLLSINQVAKRLGVCSKTVRREIKAFRLKASKVGRLVKIQPEELQAYLARQKIRRPDADKPRQGKPKVSPAQAAHEAAMERLRKAGATL